MKSAWAIRGSTVGACAAVVRDTLGALTGGREVFSRLTVQVRSPSGRIMGSIHAAPGDTLGDIADRMRGLLVGPRDHRPYGAIRCRARVVRAVRQPWALS